MKASISDYSVGHCQIMDKKNIFRDFTKYVSLSIVGMLCVSIYILADTFFISIALGPNGLTALNLSIVAFTLVHGFGLMIGIGGATKYAIQKNKNENTNTIFTNVINLTKRANCF
ncbi:MAG: hypothetical protein LBH62_09100 [Nitrososphaerota archaeon]|jgi:Na+-driven multidrug efflux pump|nr:hypothetical protein [Nitrososphaerota archaeon]